MRRICGRHCVDVYCLGCQVRAKCTWYPLRPPLSLLSLLPLVSARGALRFGSLRTLGAFRPIRTRRTLAGARGGGRGVFAHTRISRPILARRPSVARSRPRGADLRLGGLELLVLLVLLLILSFRQVVRDGRLPSLENSRQEPADRAPRHVQQTEWEEEFQAIGRQQGGGANQQQGAGQCPHAAQPGARKHRIWYRADHERREGRHEEAQHLLPRQIADRTVVVQPRLAEPVVRRERAARGGARQSREVRLRGARLFDVEAGEAEHGTRGEQENEDPVPAVGLEHREVHDHRWRETERDRVDQ